MFSNIKSCIPCTNLYSETMGDFQNNWKKDYIVFCAKCNSKQNVNFADFSNIKEDLTFDLIKDFWQDQKNWRGKLTVIILLLLIIVVKILPYSFFCLIRNKLLYLKRWLNRPGKIQTFKCFKCKNILFTEDELKTVFSIHRLGGEQAVINYFEQNNGTQIDEKTRR